VGTAWWLASDWALGTCGALDRATVWSGCVARHQVADIRPLPFVTMVATDESHVRLFGISDSEAGFIPTQLVVDLETGAVSNRQALPLPKLSSYSIIPSQGGDRVAAICILNDACETARPQGLVLSVADGAVLEPLEQVNSLSWHFPGDRPRAPYAAAWLSDEVVAEPDMVDGSIILRDPSRAEIGRLSPERPDSRGAGPGAMAVRLSNSGRYLAFVDSSRIDGSRIEIYDVATKTLIKTITTDADRKVDTNFIWAPDEEHLVLLENWNDIPTVQRGISTGLYVLKVR